MNARVWTVATGLCLASLLGCSEEGHSPTPPAATVSVVPSATSVVADGVNTVTLTVTDTGNGPINVTASRGTFVGATTIAGASGTVVLRTCNAATDTTCAGTALVTATGANSVVGTASVTFGTLATLCPASCGIDDGCAGVICTRTGGTGTCSTSSPSTCVVAGCTPTGAESCTGGVDEDCDGDVDCNDASCAPLPVCDTPTPLPRLGSLQIADPQYAVLGVKGSGWNELGGITVQALDEEGSPFPAGLTVRFEHRRFGGSTFRGPLAADDADCAAAAGCVAYEAVTAGGEGLATAYLYSGTVAGTLVVTASASLDGVTRTATLPTVAVVGAKANGANFSVVCSPRNVPALAETDCAVSLVDAPITCAAILKDRYNNLLGRPTQVVFASEAAAVGQIATTPEYDAGEDPTQQADLGIATQIFNTLGAGLPFDVAPYASGERSVDHDLDGCGVREHNPRDGVVTILAVADGEEAFFDANGNGVYDGATTPSEPFVDQGEPFVDQDDDGARDADEWFLDLDGGGTYDGPNGVWDGATKIWTQTVVVYTAQPARLDGATAGTYLGTRWADATGYVGACTATPAATPFAVYSAVTGPPPVGATSERYVVVASDWNLNVLHSGSSYEVEAEQGAKLKVFYYGLDSYADDLGFMYRYWPCDPSTSPATCASQCRSGTCLMTPSVSGFSCGVSASVTVKGGDAPDVGPVLVDWVVSTPWDVFENSKFVEAILGLSGTSVAPPP
jgi:hypothetical protein